MNGVPDKNKAVDATSAEGRQGGSPLRPYPAHMRDRHETDAMAEGMKAPTARRRGRLEPIVRMIDGCTPACERCPKRVTLKCGAGPSTGLRTGVCTGVVGRSARRPVCWPTKTIWTSTEAPGARSGLQGQDRATDGHSDGRAA